MPKTQSAFILRDREADALTRTAGKDVQISRSGDQRMLVTTKVDDQGRISASAQATFDALLAAGDLGCRDSPDAPALNTATGGGDPRGLEDALW